MVEHTQTIRRLLPTNILSVLDHLVGLTLRVDLIKCFIQVLITIFNETFYTENIPLNVTLAEVIHSKEKNRVIFGPKKDLM